MKTHNLFVFVLFFVVSNLNAQNTLDKASAQAESGAYETSIQNYKDYIAENPNDYKACIALADILASSGKYVEAEKYYILIPEDSPEYQQMGMNYAMTLKKMGRYQEIPTLLSNYIQNYPEQGSLIMEGLSFTSLEMQKKPKYDILSMPANSSSADFGLTFFHDTPVFSSFREDILMSEMQREMNKANGAHKSFKYVPTKNRIEYISGVNNNINNIGPISYAKSVNRCAYIEAKLGEIFNMEKSFKNASVHIAELNANGEMTSSKPFQYNEVGSSINSIFLSPDGRSLYFASDRVGGYGGFDLYVSHYSNNEWCLPENLGPEVNTPYNEITPFQFENTMYFASDNPTGLGGYDIYTSILVNGSWSKRTIMEREINSLEDDYFPALNDNGDLYFTSNRLGGLGKNDIYKYIKLEVEVPQEMVTDIPKAVSLEDLTRETQKHTVKENNAHVVSLRDNEEQTTAFRLPSFDPNKVGSVVESDEFWLDAHRIALDELVPNSEVFFIQLASMTAVKPNYNKFRPLLRYGNIYRMVSNNSVKIRLGYFSNRKEAEDILDKVKVNGFKDAFITFELLNTAQMELMLSSKDDKSFSDEGNFNTRNPSVVEEYKAANKYKVRLASYEDPIWFEVNKIKDLGRIEQWTKGNWTIFILAGYSSYEEAKRVQIQAVNRGFKTAEVVVDNSGILERIKQN